MIHDVTQTFFAFVFQAKYSKFVPLVAFATLSLIAGLLTLILPETNNRQLPETLEDGDRFPKYVILLS